MPRALSLRDPAFIGTVGSGWNPFSQVSALHGVWASDPSWSPPADGGAVTTWRNGGSVGGDPTQGTAANKPTYRASTAALNNRPTVEWDGNDSLSVDVADLSTPFCVLAVGSLAGSGVARSIVGFSTTTGLRLGVTSGNVWIVTDGTTLAAGTTNNSPHVLEAVVNGASSSLWLDGTQIASGGAGSSGLTHFVVGAANGSQWSGHIALALIYSGSTRNAQAARDAGAYYGITVA